MKTLREDKSDKRQMREDRVEKIFTDNPTKEYSIDDMVKKYIDTHKDDSVINYRLMSVILKNLCDSGKLSKQKRTTKENKSGRVTVSTVIYYTAPMRITVKRPIVPEVKEEPIQAKKDEKPKRKDIFDMMAKLSFAEALEKLYTGYKIVSAVSGNIYTIMDIGGKKGVTSSAEPGVIMSYFPALEMSGSWRVMDSPKSCPFCDYPVKLIHETIGEGAYFYACTNRNCMAHGPRATSPEQAVIKFNDRKCS